MRNRLLAYTLASAVLLAAIWFGVSIGTVNVPLRVLWDPGANETAANILWNIRLPRVVLAGLVGGSLAMAGAAFQGLLKNPLADPYTLGVSSGASVGAVATLFFGIGLFGSYTLPIFSMAGAMAVLLLVIGFSRAVDRSLKMETIILTGVIFGSFLGSLLSLMIALTGEELRQIIGWLLGSVSMRGWKYIWMVLPFMFIGGFMLWLCRRELNAMLFGEERAHHLGVDVRKRKWMILGGGSILTGSAVAVSGTIGFVGLVVPHMTRILFGNDHRHLLSLSFMNGASLLILCDLVARTIISPTELPVGVITSFIGAPVFAFIFYRQRRKGAVRHA
ncbi:FecCD family ABC transporter permease [Edaphobacillus lindanitolerans]|uniref:Iron complex transport system permease protein n=1 Tax=Edaphobacillus lindanitolerans TaxID=550447 RepID=A0A1U7PHV2_9BACI|nr:iron ABC transporter permease [Edaphobacillus lindanitolerans]SIT69927.1 iron complex transport system permease protein [Edaphobacillus lindanitolerans]